MKRVALVIAVVFAFGIGRGEAQILKGFGKKLEKKIEGKIDRKVDRHVDKVIDKADKETDKPINEVIDGNSSSKSNTKKASSEPVKSAPSVASVKPSPQALSEGLLMMPANSCSDFIWFKPGAMMEFETADGQGKSVNRSKMEILSVDDEGAITVAKAKASDSEGREFEMQFKCAGDKMYMDFGSMMKDVLAQAGQTGADEAQLKNAMENTEIGFSDGFLSFPKTMYLGQELDEVSFSIVSSPSPQISMEIVSSLTERKVVAKEKIKIEAGSFDCVKITGIRKTNMKVMGMNKKMDPIIEHVWFAPGIGVIKQESFNEKGKLETIMQLTAYKL